MKLEKYEKGEIIPLILQEKWNKEKEELISKIKQYEKNIKILNTNIISINKEKNELENIVIKQEDKVGKLGEKVDKIGYLLKNKNDVIRENETYSLKLINIIKDQKNQIQILKKEQKNYEENFSTKEDNINTINSLKAQITALKKKLDVKEDSFITLQKSHKILQEKYLKTCSNNRKKEQEMLLKQAKKMKAVKIEKDKEYFMDLNKKHIQLNKEMIEKKYNSLNNFKPKKKPNSAIKKRQTPKKEEKDEKEEKINNSNLGPVLPVIKSLKNKERLERLKVKNEDDGKIDEINDMMNNIINEL